MCRYCHSRNQGVVQELCEQLSQEDNSFEDNLIKRMLALTVCMVKLWSVLLVDAIYRYYESRRKLFNDSQPERLAAASDNKKRTCKYQEQKRVSLSFLSPSLTLLQPHTPHLSLSIPRLPFSYIPLDRLIRCIAMYPMLFYSYMIEDRSRWRQLKWITGKYSVKIVWVMRVIMMKVRKPGTPQVAVSA